MPVVPVDDPTDPRLAPYASLRDADLRRQGDVFICEGQLVVRRAVELGWPLRSVLLAERRRAALDDLIEALDPALPVYVVPQATLDAVAGFPLHRGVLAAAWRPRPADARAIVSSARTVAVLEGVNDAENLGALYRNAAAFGIDAVLFDPTTSDPWNRRTVRVSLGHVLAVPTARIGSLPGSLAGLGLTLVALTPDVDAEPVSVLTDLGPVALLLGAEGRGLSQSVLAAADRRVRVGLAPGVDSLNVATAAAIAFHQRFAT